VVDPSLLLLLLLEGVAIIELQCNFFNLLLGAFTPDEIVAFAPGNLMINTDNVI
jgi:hypothetical protein